MDLRECPICHTVPAIMYSCGDYFAHCSDGCIAPMCDHPAANTVALCWNDWVKWAEQHYRADPEARELTLEELRGMDGEPVWVQQIGNFEELSCWGFVALSDGYRGVVGRKSARNLLDYGKTFICYTRKPKEGV